jgi:tetratricopeptide (TPR) repeat protein
MRRALRIDEKSLGPDHPNVAIHLGNLGELLLAANRLAEAEPLMRRALKIDEKSLGPDHPNVAIRLINLGGLLRRTNRRGKAERLVRRALAINEKALGPDHPNVAIALNNLAQYLAARRPAEARPLMRRAVAILIYFEHGTGYQHPRRDGFVQNYRALLEAMGKNEAEVRAEIDAVIGNLS